MNSIMAPQAGRRAPVTAAKRNERLPLRLPHHGAESAGNGGVSGAKREHAANAQQRPLSSRVRPSSDRAFPLPSRAATVEPTPAPLPITCGAWAVSGTGPAAVPASGAAHRGAADGGRQQRSAT